VSWALGGTRAVAPKLRIGARESDRGPLRSHSTSVSKNWALSKAKISPWICSIRRSKQGAFLELRQSSWGGARSENFPASPEYGRRRQALADIAWLDWHGKQLDALLASAGLEIFGGTSFFWPARTPGADARSSPWERRLLLADFRENPNCCASACPRNERAGWQLEAIEAAPVLYQSALPFSSDRLTRRSSRVTNLLCRAESPHER
jgi:hypothetical protein